MKFTVEKISGTTTTKHKCAAAQGPESIAHHDRAVGRWLRSGRIGERPGRRVVKRR